MNLSILYQALCSALPFSIILMMISSRVGRKFRYNFSLKWIRWFLLLNWLLTGILLYLRGDVFCFLERATGPYYISYIIVLMLEFGLPPLLFFKRLRKAKLFILIISLTANAIRKVEVFTLLLISIQTDFRTEWIIWSQFIKVIIPGLLLFALFYLLEHIHTRSKNKQNSDEILGMEETAPF